MARIFIGRYTGELYEGVGNLRPISLLDFKRRDRGALSAIFVEDLAAIELPSGSTGRVGLKLRGDYDGTYLATATWTKSGTGEATVYNFDWNLNTSEIDAAFEDEDVQTEDGEEPAFLECMFEVQWSEGANKLSSTITVPARLHNDVIRGDEADPVSTAATRAFGIVDLGSSVVSGTVEFPQTLNEVPAVVLCVQVPPGESYLYAALDGAPDQEGFNFTLSGPTESANAKLHYFAECQT